MKLVKAAILRDLSEGRVPTRMKIEGSLPINLAKGESLIFAFQNAEYFKTHTRYHYVGGSSGTSFRLVKGVYLRSSSYKGERIRTDELQSGGTGYLIVTTKNLVFYGAEIVKAPLKKIIGVKPYTDGIEVFREGQNAKPMHFKIDDPFFAANLISLSNSLS
jgi:hypothetical protein